MISHPIAVCYDRKLGHSQIQIRPLGIKTGSTHPPIGTDRNSGHFLNVADGATGRCRAALMAVVGQTRPFRDVRFESVHPSITDIRRCDWHVRKAPAVVSRTSRRSLEGRTLVLITERKKKDHLAAVSPKSDQVFRSGGCGDLLRAAIFLAVLDIAHPFSALAEAVVGLIPRPRRDHGRNHDEGESREPCQEESGCITLFHA
jgi:hypothetical protein